MDVFMLKLVIRVCTFSLFNLHGFLHKGNLISYTAQKVSIFGVILVLNTKGFPLYSVRMRENADQKNVKYGHFARSVKASYLLK